MPEPPLPEDLKRWPQDPYALLGVRPGASAKEVRKAYTRLIRHYKPEQYPEHFRRIRDAFETLQRYSQWFAPAPLDDGPAPGPPTDPDEGRQSPPPPEGDFPNLEISDDAVPSWPWPRNSPGTQASAEEDELARLWERACAGEEREAYLAMRRMVDRPGSSAEICLRLYWLARVAPEVDPEQSPCHWLVQGLRSGGWYGPCREQYRREIERCPTEALTERFAGLLQMEAPLPVLAEWLAWRWRAAGTLRRWYVITADLEALRPRFTANLEDESWARLLLTAIDHLAWSSDAEAEKATLDYGAEVESLTHLHSRIDLHRLDILRDLSHAWKQLPRSEGALAGLLDLVPSSWTQPPYNLRQAVQAALKDVMRKPEKALELFDALNAAAPLVFVQVVYQIDGVAYEALYRDRDFAEASDLERPAAAFLELIPSYCAPSREEFLQFCLREFVLPEEALRVMEGLQKSRSVSLAWLREDVALRIVCVAYRWFWR